MEESCDMHSGDNEVPAEKNKKRRLKTPFQVEALEKFYNEHKYPTEAMKAQVAEEIGLSEKQVSGWFCHRRLKDKKLLRDEAYANGKQDHSSGMIQDRGSGLRQDSCGSTKQGDHRNFDPREVESRDHYGQDYLAAEPAYKHRGHNVHTRNNSALDNTSSGSSSASHDRFFHQSDYPFYKEPLRYSSRNANCMLTNMKGVERRRYISKPGYLNMQDDIEHGAITAVKMHLGRHYQEDGPQLGVEFQPLPPGAFDSPIRDPVHEPYYVGEPSLPNSHSDLMVCKEPSYSARCDKNGFKMSSQDSYSEVAHFRGNMWESDNQKCFSYCPSTQKSSITSYSNPVPDRNSAMNMDEDSAGEASVLNSSRNQRLRSKPGVEGMRLDVYSEHNIRTYGGKVSCESPYQWSHNNNDAGTNVFHARECLEPDRSSYILRPSDSLFTEDKGKLRKLMKASVFKQEEKLSRERRIGKDYCSHALVNMPVTNEKRAGRQVTNEFHHQGCVSKTPSPEELPQWMNPIKGSGGEMPTSFSEAEAEETSSSMD